MSGDRANSHGGNDHNQPFTRDCFIPTTTATPVPVGGLNFKDSVLLAEFNRIAQMLDWDNTNTNSLNGDFPSDHLNYGPYVEWPYPPSMNLNARINGTDVNLSDKNHFNVNDIYFSPDSSFDNNEPVTPMKYSLNDPYNLTVDLPWSKGTDNASNLTGNGIADLQVTKKDTSGCSCMSCHVQKNGPTKDSKFLEKESVSSMIVIMHNLSELLLYHCSSEMCEFREQDLESLEKVIDRLNTCMLKRNGRESVSKLHQGISIGKHPGSKDDTFSDSVSVRSVSDMRTMIDKSDQAVKVLIKDLLEKEERRQVDLFFKNLSLKVEARSDNMKIEMEECKPDKEKDVDEHSISELDGIDKLATKVKDSPVSLPGTACNSYSDDEFDDDYYDDEDDWEFVSDEQLLGLNSSS